MLAVLATALAFGLCAAVKTPWVWFIWIALLPWLAALGRCESTGGALVLGWLLCVVFTVAVFGWFADAIASYTGIGRATAWILLVVGAPLLQPQFIPFAWVRHVLSRSARPTYVAVAAAFTYVGTESAWPKLFADTLGHSLHALPTLRQAADLAGAPGLTFMILLVNQWLYDAVVSCRTKRWRSARALACAVAVILGLTLYGEARRSLFATAAVGEGEAPLRVGLVQANLANYDALRREHGTFDVVRMILDEHFSLSRDALASGGIDLLMWPETVYPTTFGNPKSKAGADFDAEIRGFVATTAVPLIFGAYEAEGGEEFNAAFFLDLTASGELRTSSYRKTWLFPLTEQVPAVLDSAGLRGLFPWLGSWHAGSGSRTLDINLADGRSLRVAPLICLDAVDSMHTISAVRNGADAIVTLSNDSWFAETSGARLHLVVSAFRSIETRRPQLRVTNTGISAVIGTDGEISVMAGAGERKVLVASAVLLRDARTLMLAWGDWFGPTALVAAVVLLLGGLLRRG